VGAVSRRAALSAAAVLAGGVLLAGCGQPAADSSRGAPVKPLGTSAAAESFHGTLVEPTEPRPDLELPTTTGEPFTVADRPDGEVTLVFFGYTHCPDLCPTTMADLAAARAMLPPEVRDRVEVVFITEDPARDSPELVRTWLDRFDPEFTGLIGGNEATARAQEKLYLPKTQRVDNPPEPVVHPHDDAEAHSHGDYSVDHAGIVWAWGPGDRAVIYTGGTTPAQYAEDLTRLATGP
jgi:protein SCO1/2